MAWEPPPDADPRDVVEQLARDILAVFTEAEARLLADIARRARTAGSVNDELLQKGSAVREVRLAVERMLTQLRAESGSAAAEAVLAAWKAGAAAGLAQLADAGALDRSQLAALRDVIPGMDAAVLLAADLTSRLDALYLRVLRWAQDAYQVAVAAAAPLQLLGMATTRSAQRSAWDRLASQGVTGFVDRSGRAWNLASYTEMAVRTATARAWNDGHLARMEQLGVELVTVSNTTDGCELCSVWQGKILARDGDAGPRTVENELTGEPVEVDVAATVEQARAAGLFHPNCRHTLLPYLPGVTRLAEPAEHDQAAEDEREHLRELERKVRREKRKEAGALDDTDARKAQARIRELQAEIREHVDATGVNRKRYREQTNLGHGTAGTARARRKAVDEQLVEDTVEQARLDAVAAEQARRRVQERLAAEQAEQQAREQLAAELAELTDDDLDARLAEVADDETGVDAVLAEMDRRQAEANAAQARRERDRERREQQREQRRAEQLAVYERLVADGMDDEQAWARATGTTVERLHREDAIRRLRADGYTGRGFDELARAAYRDYVAEQFWQAEADTNGYLLNNAGEAAGIDPRELFTGPVGRARKWASDELLGWWDDHGRMSFDEYAAWLLGNAAIARDAGRRTGGEDWLQ
ncbi:phage minor capsid protein [Lentzea sp. HUAS TT2]|uniref:phage minor capsid protein n=1 Tax=Lentzea sp. HUAS TT2 TaxID=3447454 RepID=UPI003F703E6B